MRDKELSPQQRLLLVMHNVGAILGRAGKTIDELARLTDIDHDQLDDILTSHIKAGYIDCSIDETCTKRYLLTGRGIIRVSSLYT